MKLSIVVPAFNEEGNLRALHARLSAVASRCTGGVKGPGSHEIIFVDDGSRDGTLGVVRELAAADPAVRYVSFSRNFGHEVASTAGLDRTTGDAVVLIDADLQDPPEVIEEMVARWRAGVQVAYAQRRRRAGEPAARRLGAYLFYRLLGRLSDVHIPPDTGDFRLMDRRVVRALGQCRENPRYVRGLVSWVGFRQEAVLYDRDERLAGETKYNFRKLLRLSFEAIAAFSLKPLKITMWLGLLTIAASFLLAGVVAGQKLVYGIAIPGYALLASGMFFLGGVQLTMLGIMAHYLGQVFVRSQGRPMYIVGEEAGGEAGGETTGRGGFVEGKGAAGGDVVGGVDGGGAIGGDDGRSAVPGNGRAGAGVLVVRREAAHRGPADRPVA